MSEAPRTHSPSCVISTGGGRWALAGIGLRERRLKGRVQAPWISSRAHAGARPPITKSGSESAKHRASDELDFRFDGPTLHCSYSYRQILSLSVPVSFTSPALETLFSLVRTFILCLHTCSLHRRCHLIRADHLEPLSITSQQRSVRRIVVFSPNANSTAPAATSKLVEARKSAIRSTRVRRSDTPLLGRSGRRDIAESRFDNACQAQLPSTCL